MYNVTQTFKDYAESINRQIALKVDINGTEYGMNSIVNFTITEDLASSDELTIGEVIVSKLTLKIRTTDTIATGAYIIPYVRFCGNNGYSEWLKLKKYYIDTRDKADGIYTFICYDTLLASQVEYNSDLTYPAKVSDVWSEILTKLNLTASSNVSINQSYEIPYKDEDITIREMLGYIASMHGGNIILNNKDEVDIIQLTVPDEVITINKSKYFSGLKEYDDRKTYTQVKCIYNDDGECIYSTGYDFDLENSQTISFYNPYLVYDANADAIDNIKSIIDGFYYDPISFEWIGYPYVGVGDRIHVEHDNGTYETTILNNSITYDGGINATSDAPCITEKESEYNYTGSITKSLQKAVKTDTDYYGFSVSKTKGLTVTRLDGSGEVILNADELAFYANGEAKIYFDPKLETYVFDGTLSADAITSMTTNSEKGNIAELTVDQLDTSTKVKNYLNSDTSDVNYIKIKGQTISFITATTDGSNTEQLTDRKGTPLYWTDDTHTTITYEETDYPVYIYTYQELTKMSFSFVYNSSTGYYEPKIVIGSGTSPENPTWGRVYIEKSDDGGKITYYSSTNGKERSITFGDNGVTTTSSDGLRNIKYYDDIDDAEDDINNIDDGDLVIVPSTSS